MCNIFFYTVKKKERKAHTTKEKTLVLEVTEKVLVASLKLTQGTAGFLVNKAL